MCPQVHYIMYAFTSFPQKKEANCKKFTVAFFHRFIASIAHCKWTPLYTFILAAVILKYSLAVVCFSHINCVKTLECFKTLNSSQTL